MYKFCVGSQNNTIETWMKTGVFFIVGVQYRI